MEKHLYLENLEEYLSEPDRVVRCTAHLLLLASVSRHTLEVRLDERLFSTPWFFFPSMSYHHAARAHCLAL